MATVNIVYIEANEITDYSSVISLDKVIASFNITSSALSQATSTAATKNQLALIVVSGGNVWAKAGSAPTASAGNDLLCINGTVTPVTIASGDKIAVIDA